MIDPRYTKAVDSLMTLQSETNTSKSITNDSVTYTLCDRDDTADRKGNYFMSFNLPTNSNDLGTGSTLSVLYPELQQLNVDKIIISPIPSSSYSECIDGRSITWKVPQAGGGSQTTLSSITVYSSTYSSDKPLKGETNLLLGDNIAFLFCDTINKPYSGYTVDEMGVRTSHATNTTWEPDSTNFLRRPSAVSFSEVRGNAFVAGYNTDTRAVVKYAAQVPTNYPDNRSGYNYDIPVGFVVLDKGFMVLTHSAVTNNFPWTQGYTQAGSLYAGSDTAGKTNIYFTGTTNGTDKASQITFKDVNTSFKQTAVCLAMPTEFYISNNSTWNREKALTELNQQSGIVSLDPVYISEIGLYNALGELIAAGKTSEPVEKTYASVVTFNVNIEL